MEKKHRKLYYKIGEACRALDIQPYVLRYWETEFPILAPSKSKSGQRVYAEKELDVIRRIKELLYDEGYTIAGAKKKLEGEMALGLSPGAAPPPAAEPPELHLDPAPAVEQPAPERKRAAPIRAAQNVLPLADSGAAAAERRRRIERALAEAREILALLDRH